MLVTVTTNIFLNRKAPIGAFFSCLWIDRNLPALYNKCKGGGNMMNASDYFVLFISPTVYEHFLKEGDAVRFEKLNQYAPMGAHYEYCLL